MVGVEVDVKLKVFFKDQSTVTMCAKLRISPSFKEIIYLSDLLFSLFHLTLLQILPKI